MVNTLTKRSQPVSLALIHNTTIPPVYASKCVELFQDARAHVLSKMLDLNQTVETTCHIHVSKQITIVDSYAEMELPETCMKLY
ncbi:MAG: hypothetical protein N2B02_03180 [Amylibacter sp.]